MNKWNKEHPLRLFEAFAGYGSQSMALDRIKEIDPTFNYYTVGISEIDKYAVQAYGDAMWKVQCSCGVKFMAKGKNLRSGNTISCGCYNRELLRALRNQSISA